jgi:thiol-disulfide isomerase/thioredoxin
MMPKLFLLLGFATLTASHAFVTRPIFGSFPSLSQTALLAVIEIGSEAAFDKKIKSSGDSLVIVDYSTTWCGPCKGKFHKMADCTLLVGVIGLHAFVYRGSRAFSNHKLYLV